MLLSRRVQRIKPSLTVESTIKAEAMKAEGIGVIDFGAGEPDFETPENIKEAAIQAIRDGFTKYTVVGGTTELKDAIIEKLRRENGLTYRRSEILVSCGAKHSLYNLSQALFDTGDEVIIPSPYWVSYPDQVELADATPRFVETSEDSAFKMTGESLEKALSPRTKAIVLNSPCNPTGTAYTRRELEEIAEIALSKGIYVISDEVYEHIVYDGHCSVSIASLSEDMKRLTMLINSVSKSYSMTGWRIGYAAGSQEIIAAMTKIQGQSTSNPSSISQKASVEALRYSEKSVKMMAAEFEKRRNYVYERLSTIEGFSCFKPMGAFYAFPNVSQLYGKSYRGWKVTSSSDLAAYLLEETSVMTVAGIGFGDDRYIRISYATSMENLKEGLDRIERAVAKLE
ncbi:MAG: pyridoxal phosphate-dependent aminotransferase [Candidatus Tectomicrobia bacterium]|nr:pyridoxal phosphate-dependent aminotransferase [Candidatus Tectomicrobia bacterium]